jgi:hypothetical protein
MLIFSKNLLTGHRREQCITGEMKMKNSSRGENDFTGMYYPVIMFSPGTVPEVL